MSGRERAAPARGLWRPDIVRAVLSGHSILGIAFGAIIYLICLTGSIAVLQRDLDRLQAPHMPEMAKAAPRAVARAVAAITPRLAAGDTLYVTMPSPDLPRLTLTAKGPATDISWNAAPDGSIAGETRTSISDFIVDLHERLLLPKTWGRLLVGLAGVALLSSLVSGVLAHPRIVRDAFHLRLRGARRLEQADLHNRLGVWALPFHVAISLTGALLGLSTIIVGALGLLLFRGDTQRVYALLGAQTAAAAGSVPASPPDLARILVDAQARSPGAAVQTVTLSHWGRNDASVAVTASRPTLMAAQDTIAYDAMGRVTSERHPGQLNVGQQLLGSLGPLHFGWFGGVAIRIAWVLLGLATCVVTVSGINVWLARRRDRGTPLPRLERCWAAIVWGQPAMLAWFAVWLLRAGDPPPIIGRVYWVATLGLAVTASLVGLPPARIGRWCRWLTVGGLAVGACLAAVA